MKDKLIKIKRSRLKQEELFLIDMLNNLEFLEFNDNINWVKNRKGEKYTYIETYFTYNPIEKYICVSNTLVFDKIYDLFGKNINIQKTIVDFFSSQFKIEINNYKQYL